MNELKNYVVRYVLDGLPVSGSVAVTSGLVEEARSIHLTTPVATAALGRALTLVGMMGVSLKDGGKVTFQIQCRGPLKALVSQGNFRGEVRGYVSQPAVILPSRQAGKLNVEEAVGIGSQLVVVKDMGTREPSVGSVRIENGGIASDLASYFVQSEQLPSACGAGVLVDRDGTVLAAGGYLVHTPSGTDEAAIQRIEENISGLDQVSSMVESRLDAQGMAALLFKGLPWREVERKELRYHCPCSRNRAERALMMLGKEEIVTLLDTVGRGEINCPFCNETYLFSRDELEKIAQMSEERDQ